MTSHGSSQISIQSPTTKGESDAKSAHAFSDPYLIFGGRRLGAIAEQQPQQETTHDHAPRESAAVEISHPIPNSSGSHSPAMANSAGLLPLTAPRSLNAGVPS